MMRILILLLATTTLSFFVPSFGFSSSTTARTGRLQSSPENAFSCKHLSAKPARLEDNEEGVLYVNDRCINCAACSYFAPNTFTRSSSSPHHVVYNQPTDISSDDFLNARAALAACPVSAIRATSQAELQHLSKIRAASQTEVKAEVKLLTPHEVEVSKAFALNTKINGIPLPFPRALTQNVWMVGHHSEKTFGAAPYIVKGRHHGKDISVLVDVPKFSQSAIQTVQSVSSPDGPDYMFLTHVDDTAQQLQWKERFPNMKRVFHAGDLGEHNWTGDESLEDVEILLKGVSDVENEKLLAFSLDSTATDTIRTIDCSGNSDVDDQVLNAYRSMDSDFVIFHTPGHSPGSISLLHRLNGGTLFTGDTYTYTTRDGGRMSGFPQYGHDLPLQIWTLECFKRLSSQYECVASGHGHPRRYRTTGGSNDTPNDHVSVEDLKYKDTEDAISELQSYN